MNPIINIQLQIIGSIPKILVSLYNVLDELKVLKKTPEQSAQNATTAGISFKIKVMIFWLYLESTNTMLAVPKHNK